MTKPPILQLDALLRRFGVENEELLDALKWKYRKIYTEKEMAIRERDKARAELKSATDMGVIAAQHNEIAALRSERDRLRAELGGLYDERHLFLIDEERGRLRNALHAAAAERDRLREALEQVMANLEYSAKDICDIARAALAKEGQ